jgi:hypothetical protein
MEGSQFLQKKKHPKMPRSNMKKNQGSFTAQWIYMILRWKYYHKRSDITNQPGISSETRCFRIWAAERAKLVNLQWSINYENMCMLHKWGSASPMSAISRNKSDLETSRTMTSVPVDSASYQKSKMHVIVLWLYNTYQCRPQSETSTHDILKVLCFSKNS